MKQAFTKVHTKILAEMLRLPPDVRITAIRTDPDNPARFILDLEGTWFPSEGELIAEYSWMNTTIPKFEKWRQLEQKEKA